MKRMMKAKEQNGLAFRIRVFASLYVHFVMINIYLSILIRR